MIRSSTLAISFLALSIFSPVPRPSASHHGALGNELEMWEFVERMRPQVVIPSHDGQAKPFFVDHRYEFLAEEFDKAGIRFISLKKPGDSHECAHA